MLVAFPGHDARPTLCVCYLEFPSGDAGDAGADTLRHAGFTVLFVDQVYAYALKVVRPVDHAATNDEVLKLIVPMGGWCPESEELSEPVRGWSQEDVLSD